MTISFSYAYLNGLDRLMVSSDCVVTAVHLCRRATSPRRTESQCWIMAQLSARTVHQDSLGNVIGIVACHNMVHSKTGGTAVERLATEHATEGAVVAFSDLVDDLVHCPSVELVVGQNLEREAVLGLVLLDGLGVSGKPQEGGEGRQGTKESKAFWQQTR